MADMEMREIGATLGVDFREAYEAGTSFVPMRRPAHAAEVARAIGSLLSEKASYINAAVLPIDGGTITDDPGSLALDPRVTSARQRTEGTR